MRTFVALIHYPVHNRGGERVASAVTHSDVHDIARTARAYGLAGYYLVHPVEAQRRLVAQILRHWEEAADLGAHRRQEALLLVRLVPDLATARGEIARACGAPPFVVATSAVSRSGSIDVGELRVRSGSRPLLVLFGTGWGLCPEVFAEVDATLDPIDLGTGYNHLPVRAAVAIVLDRLLGR